jgi:hypothetical protein
LNKTKEVSSFFSSSSSSFFFSLFLWLCALPFPLSEFPAAEADLQVKKSLEPGGVVVNERKVLILHCAADLHGRRPGVQKLQGNLGAVNAARRQNREARELRSNKYKQKKGGRGREKEIWEGLDAHFTFLF